MNYRESRKDRKKVYIGRSEEEAKDLMVHLFCHFILVEVFTACLTSDMVMTLYCSFRDIESFAASFASWSAISFPAI
jgi:hypothetical protein